MMLNYANPNAMVTWAANKYGGVETLGQCHGVQERPRLDRRGPGAQEDLKVIFAGINHMTWYISVKHKGVDMTDKLLEGYEAIRSSASTEKVRIDMLKRFGYYSTGVQRTPVRVRAPGTASAWTRDQEVDRHLRLDPRPDRRLPAGIREGRNWFETDFPNWLQEPAFKFGPDTAPRARLLHHRGPGDRRVPRPLQPHQQRHHHQPAR